MPSLALHAAHPNSLADPALAALVRACAEETAEHQGVAAPTVRVFDNRIELEAELPQAVLLAIAAEVRRATGRWHRAKHGSALWHGE
jgi:Zn-dependent M32 family carboxypeptidase